MRLLLRLRRVVALNALRRTVNKVKWPGSDPRQASHLQQPQQQQQLGQLRQQLKQD